ncbi:zinc metalloprotease [Pseudomonas sp. XS1P51]
MFKSAGLRFMRRFFSALSMVSLAVLLGACMNPSPSDTGEPKSWVVENIASKTTQELYADLIAPGVFERSSSKVIDGYTVESGNLRMPDKNDGSLVTVRSADGSLTALINRPGQRGSLHIDSTGMSRFIPEPAVDMDAEDAVTNLNEKVATAPVDLTSAEPLVVDVLMGYSKAGVDRMGGDPGADALAKVEWVNLMLRNSLVLNVSLNLAGVQVVEDDYPITTETLAKLPVIFSQGMDKFKPDVIYGNFAYIVPGGAIGWGYRPGRTAIGVSSSASTFAHELGHNAGSQHCNYEGVANYRFGYDNGKSRSVLCNGSNSRYYSTPAIIDQYGLPLGNTETADTARVWRENASRLSGYAPPFVGTRMSLVSIGKTAVAELELRMPAIYQAGIVALKESEGPIKLQLAPAGYARLTVKLKDGAGNERDVYLRGERVVGGCKWLAMNAYQGCSFSGEAARDLTFKLIYNKADNPQLPATIYSGYLKLEVRNLLGSWVVPIDVLISIRGAY